MSRVKLIAACGAAVAVLSLSACGSDDGKDKEGVASADGGQKAADAAKNPLDTKRAYAACLKDEGVAGVTVDDKGQISLPAVGMGGGGGADITTASATCKAKVPGAQQVFEKTPAQLVENARKFVQCSRDSGLTDMPDPDPNTGRIKLTRNYPTDQWVQVYQKCSAQAPGGLGVDYAEGQ